MRPLRSPSKGAARGRRTPGSAGFPRMGPGHSSGRRVRVLHPRAAGLPHVHGAPAGSEAGRRFAGPGRLHRPGHPEGPAGLPAQRAHGVRVRVRPRRVPRARLHRRLPAPLLGSRQALLRRSRLGLGRAQDDRGPPHQPLRRADEDPDADPGAGRGVPPARAALQPVLLRPDDRARPACQGDHRSCGAAPADGVLRVDGVGGVDQSTGAQLLLHEQLAARAARR